MKILRKNMLAFLIPALLISCGSTPKNEVPAVEPEKPAPVTRELKVISSQPVTVTETPAQKFEKQIKGIKISIISTPKETSVSRAFSSPYVIKAMTKTGTPCENFEIAVTYPESKDQGNISFTQTILKTDAQGTVSFVPPVPSASFDSILTAYPNGDVTDPEIAEIAVKYSVTAPYKVKTNLLSAGGTIALLDFTASGKPVTNNSVSSSNLLMTMMKYGFTRIGNADFTNDILKDDPHAVYRSAKNLLGNNSSFIIYGTVKYNAPVEQVENGYKLTLVADVKCINMKTGSVVHTTTQTATVTEEKDWNCLPAARKVIAEKISASVLYGL